MCVYIKGFVDGDVDCFQSGSNLAPHPPLLHGVPVHNCYVNLAPHPPLLHDCGVPTISWLLKIIGLFGKKAL